MRRIGFKVLGVEVFAVEIVEDGAQTLMEVIAEVMDGDDGPDPEADIRPVDFSEHIVWDAVDEDDPV